MLEVKNIVQERMPLIGSSRKWHSWKTNLAIKEMLIEMSKIEMWTEDR